MNSQIDQKIYQQLKSIANKLMASERNNHTLSPTDLVHEAFIKFNYSTALDLDEQQYIFALARQMRRLLVDYGRHKNAQKRGGNMNQVLYTDALGINDNSMTDFSIISDAIDALEAMDKRAAQAIDLYYFTTVDKSKAAAMLDISVATIERDLRFAKAHISQYIDEFAQ